MTHELGAPEAVVQLDRDDAVGVDAAPAAIIAAWLLGDERGSRSCRLARLSERSVVLSCEARDLPAVNQWLTTLLAEPRLTGWRVVGSAGGGPDPEPAASGSGPYEAL
jgi:hypothetical protein